jgi:hypothetical protein
LTFTGEIEAAIDEVNSIRGVGMAYGSKHLKFWGNYPVLDTRLSWLIFGEKLKPTAGGNDYVIYFQIIQELAGFFGLSPCETEEALFAFSERYFLHDKLTMKEGLVRGNGHDQRIANELCNAL